MPNDQRGPETTGWLIERRDLGPRPQWIAPGRRPGWHAWTDDANEATRFATREAAEAECCGGDIDGPLLVTEHVFMDAPHAK